MRPVQIKDNDLTYSVDARVRSSRSRYSQLLACDPAQRRLNLALNSPRVPSLPLKAQKICAVVGNFCTKPHTHSIIAIGALSPLRGPSLLMRV